MTVTQTQMNNFLDLAERDGMIKQLAAMYRANDDPSSQDTDGALLYACVVVQIADRFGVSADMDEIAVAVRERWNANPA